MPRSLSEKEALGNEEESGFRPARKGSRIIYMPWLTAALTEGETLQRTRISECGNQDRYIRSLRAPLFRVCAVALWGLERII